MCGPLEIDPDHAQYQADVLINTLLNTISVPASHKAIRSSMRNRNDLSGARYGPVAPPPQSAAFHPVRQKRGTAALTPVPISHLSQRGPAYPGWQRSQISSPPESRWHVGLKLWRFWATVPATARRKESRGSRVIVVPPPATSRPTDTQGSQARAPPVPKIERGVVLPPGGAAGWWGGYFRPQRTRAAVRVPFFSRTPPRPASPECPAALPALRARCPLLVQQGITAYFLCSSGAAVFWQEGHVV